MDTQYTGKQLCIGEGEVVHHTCANINGVSQTDVSGYWPRNIQYTYTSGRVYYSSTP